MKEESLKKYIKAVLEQNEEINKCIAESEEHLSTLEKHAIGIRIRIDQMKEKVETNIEVIKILDRPKIAEDKAV